MQLLVHSFSKSVSLLARFLPADLVAISRPLSVKLSMRLDESMDVTDVVQGYLALGAATLFRTINHQTHSIPKVPRSVSIPIASGAVANKGSMLRGSFETAAAMDKGHDKLSHPESPA